MDKTQFEEQKAIIFEKAHVGLEQIKHNLDVLNRNLQVMNSIGIQFQEPANLWDSFHKAIGPSDEDKTEKKPTTNVSQSFTNSTS